MNPVDNLWTTRRQGRSNPVDNLKMFDRYLTRSVRFAACERLWPYSSLALHLTGLLCLIVGLLAIQTQTAHAKDSDHYRLYAHSRIVDFKEFSCFNKIISKESNWNVNAKNGSHHGLGQMRSKWYRNLDGYRQIDETLKYIKKRYSTPCNAWEFHQRKNYF